VPKSGPKIEPKCNGPLARQNPAIAKPAMMSITPRCLLPALALVAMLALHAPARADSMFEISTDDLFEDNWSDQVVARGNVEIRYFGEIVSADEVVYDRRARKLSARGNVTFQDAEGKVTRASKLNLHDDARDAFVAYARRQKLRVDR
jgi:lipopolysaccharide assembly outer membrane protein LptD (OstA)